MSHKMKPSQLTKREWKICEAVHLGLTHYYLNGPKDKRELTDGDYKEAEALLSALDPGWWEKHQEWMVCKGRKIMEED